MYISICLILTRPGINKFILIGIRWIWVLNMHEERNFDDKAFKNVAVQHKIMETISKNM
jgi:hypothetical protein